MYYHKHRGLKKKQNTKSVISNFMHESGVKAQLNLAVIHRKKMV